VVGAGAAGLATAIFTRRLNPHRSVVLVDGASRLGAKILVSGGARCNVTNTAVTDADFWGGRRSVIRHVLRGFPSATPSRSSATSACACTKKPAASCFPTRTRRATF